MAFITCCKDCKDRHPACHDSCERYKNEKARSDEIVGMMNEARHSSTRVYLKDKSPMSKSNKVIFTAPHRR